MQNASAASSSRWRTVDIVVTAVLGAVFGVVFWAWGLFWNGPAAAIPAPFNALLYGVWLIPPVLGPLVVRKPGAGVFASVVAAAVSAFLGSSWGLTTVVYGLVQGVAGEAAFAAFRYRGFRLPVALLGGLLAGIAASVLDITMYYSANAVGVNIGYAACVMLSCVVVAGWGSWALTRGLAQTGALDPFPSGRERAAV
ncbi:ECF transporter S component [Streptomyces sp. NPDC060194]|uniref:ECF transporter S component n=1 Tax=Streptomyces sp. NPDC060194 TaxID=3347069 RepID=UPI0036505D25